MIDEHDYIVCLAFKHNLFMKILNSLKQLQFLQLLIQLQLQFKVRLMRNLSIFRLIKQIFAFPKTIKVIRTLVVAIARVLARCSNVLICCPLIPFFCDGYSSCVLPCKLARYAPPDSITRSLPMRCCKKMPFSFKSEISFMIQEIR